MTTADLVYFGDTPVAGPVRPPTVPRPPLPPFDASDAGGLVHTTLPPEQVLPTVPDIDFCIADGGGLTLPDSQIMPPPITGQNSNQRMGMSWLITRYPRPWWDTWLYYHATAGMTHLHSDWFSSRWTGDGTGLTAAQFADYLAYVQSWGFFTSYWGFGTSDGHFNSWAEAAPLLQPVLDALKAAGSSVCQKTILVIGEELNSCTSPTGLLDIVQHVSPQCQDLGIRTRLHFTFNYPAWPIGTQTKVEFWQSMHALGIGGLYWQGNSGESAGMMGARLWDTRQYMAQASQDLHCTAFELLWTNQLEHWLLADGRAPTEAMGNLRSFEMLCCTRLPGTNVPAVAGSGNGPRFPNGQPLIA